MPFNIIDCRRLLNSFDDKREGLVLVYLLALADEEGWVKSSIYAMARELDMHRQTLTRLLHRLFEKGFASWNSSERKGLRVECKRNVTSISDTALSHSENVTFHSETALSHSENVTFRSEDELPTAENYSPIHSQINQKFDSSHALGVTGGVTSDVTDFSTSDGALSYCDSEGCKSEENRVVTGSVTHGVTDFTPDGTTKEETKENKEKNPPTPPKKEKKQKKEEKTLSNGHAREKNPDSEICFANLFNFSPLPTQERSLFIDEPTTATQPSLLPTQEAILFSDEPTTTAQPSLLPTQEAILFTDEPMTITAPAPMPAQKKKKTKASETLEERRQQFLDALTPYIDRYGEEMVRRFGEYWTEPNLRLTRMRFEMQTTWSTPMRLARWARNEQSFNKNNYYHDTFHKPTPNDYIADAQQFAINATEDFIRQAESRRGGIPPHLPL